MDGYPTIHLSKIDDKARVERLRAFCFLRDEVFMAEQSVEDLCQQLRELFRAVLGHIKELDCSKEEKAELTKQAKEIEAAMNKFCKNRKFKRKP